MTLLTRVRLRTPPIGDTALMRIGSLVLLVWLVIGVLAAFQRDYFADDDVTCAKGSTIALTIAAGPLNYLGVNPKTDCPDIDVQVPQPSE